MKIDWDSVQAGCQAEMDYAGDPYLVTCDPRLVLFLQEEKEKWWMKWSRSAGVGVTAQVLNKGTLHTDKNVDVQWYHTSKGLGKVELSYTAGRDGTGKAQPGGSFGGILYNLKQAFSEMLLLSISLGKHQNTCTRKLQHLFNTI